jgi:phosphatidate cytidylyltransferase
MSNLALRFLTAVVLVPVLIWLILLGGIPFTALVALAVFAALYEFFNMMEARGFKPMKKTSYVLGVSLVAVAHFSNEYYLTLLVTFSILSVMVVQLSKKDINASITGMAVTALGLLYVPWLLSHAVLVRNLGNELVLKYGELERFRRFVRSPEQIGDFAEALSLFFIFIVFACTFLNDTGAYFAGRFFGKHKFAPTVSPKKTWEGFIGGVLTSMLAACAVKWVFDNYVPGGDLVKFPYGGCLILGGLLGTVGAMGDLVESLIKRDADIKDSGALLPGHGGMLDRIDALLFTFPFTYYVAKIHYFVRFGGDLVG